MNPRVQTVSPLKNYKIALTFSNGEEKIYDCNPLLDFGIFKELRDVSYFNSVKVMGGTISWNMRQDICPDTLYIDAKPVSTIQ